MAAFKSTAETCINSSQNLALGALPGFDREMKTENSNHSELEQFRSCIGTACSTKKTVEEATLLVTISSKETAHTEIVKESGPKVACIKMAKDRSHSVGNNSTKSSKYALRVNKAQDSNAIHTTAYSCMPRHAGKRKLDREFSVLKKKKKRSSFTRKEILPVVVVNWVQCDNCDKWRIVQQKWPMESFKCTDISALCSDVCDYIKGRLNLAYIFITCSHTVVLRTTEYTLSICRHGKRPEHTHTHTYAHTLTHRMCKGTASAGRT